MFFIGDPGHATSSCAPARPELFAKHASGLNKPLAGVNTLVLIFSVADDGAGGRRGAEGRPPRTIALPAAHARCARSGSWASRTSSTTTSSPTTRCQVRASRRTTPHRQSYVYDGHVHRPRRRRAMVTGYRDADCTSTTELRHPPRQRRGRRAPRCRRHGRKTSQRRIDPARRRQRHQLRPVEEHLLRLLLRPDRRPRHPRDRRDRSRSSLLLIQALPRQALPRPHGVHRPVLALRRPGLDLPVPAAVPDLSRVDTEC